MLDYSIDTETNLSCSIYISFCRVYCLGLYDWPFSVLGGGGYPGMIQLQAGQPLMHTDMTIANNNLSNAGGYKTVDGRYQPYFCLQ